MNPVTVFRVWRAWRALMQVWEEWTMRKEPVALAALVRSAAVLLAVFGLALTPEQIAAVIVVTELVLGVVVRARVSPV